MRTRRKILAAFVAVPTLTVAAGAVAISRDGPCRGPEPTPQGTTSMQAVVYGGSVVLNVDAVARPVPAADEVLVRVHAASRKRGPC